MTSDRWDEDIESQKSEVKGGSSAWWMMHISTHTHTFTHFLNLIDALHSSVLYTHTLFHYYCFSLSGHFLCLHPLMRASCHHALIYQSVWAEWHNFTHTHLQSATISLSQLQLFVIPLPSIPRSCVWPHLITAAMSLCLTASHSLVRSHLTADFIRAHLVVHVWNRMSSAVSVVSSA